MALHNKNTIYLSSGGGNLFRKPDNPETSANKLLTFLQFFQYQLMASGNHFASIFTESSCVSSKSSFMAAYDNVIF